LPSDEGHPLRNFVWAVAATVVGGAILIPLAQTPSDTAPGTTQQDPPASIETTPPVIVPTTAPVDTPGTVDEPPAPPSLAFLSDMEPTEEDPAFYSLGALEISGESYPHSVSHRVGGCEKSGYISFNLGRDWTTFSATFGLRDESEASTVVRSEVYLDGNLAYTTGDVGLGATEQVSISTVGVLNLRLAYYFLEGSMGLCSDAGDVAWGDAQVSR